MVRTSYKQKPFRKIMIETWGGKVFSSPSPYTASGKKFLEIDPEHPGSLGIAISEAIERALNSSHTKYCLGSVLNHVILHQTIIGLETKLQMEKIGLYPDYVIGVEGVILQV